ncbi:DUF4258 domain-containing protein [Oceanobacillus oncorhynchi]|uniref:DUF4258 domain-containing protein n=2 Tax=Bacillaceae TaxID=186817 RepID=UPI000A9F9C02|nr:DUF4258 domain-containing protein [Oceanobacillus oncorhynchi]
MATIMECKHVKECKRKAEIWQENQEKYSAIGQHELDDFLELYDDKKAAIKMDQHFEKRCVERAISTSDVTSILEFGWVIERNETLGNVSVVLLGFTGKPYKPLHVVYHIVSERKWVAVTAYRPISQPWKWSKNYDKRICFCVKDGEL